jgi:hypothetical protein
MTAGGQSYGWQAILKLRGPRVTRGFDVLQKNLRGDSAPSFAE